MRGRREAERWVIAVVVVALPLTLALQHSNRLARARALASPDGIDHLGLARHNAFVARNFAGLYGTSLVVLSVAAILLAFVIAATDRIWPHGPP